MTGSVSNHSLDSRTFGVATEHRSLVVSRSTLKCRDVRTGTALEYGMSNESLEDDKSTGLNLLQIIVALGGYASVAYAVGYVYRFAYLDVFGATFLITHVGYIEAMFGTAATLGPLIPGIAGVLLEPHTHGERYAKVSGISLFLVGVVLILIERCVGPQLVETARSWICGVASAAFMVVAIASAELIASRRGRARPLFKPIIAFTLCAFILSPFCSGLREGHYRAASADTRMPAVHIRGSSQPAYLLLTSENHVFCLTRGHALSPGLILRVGWDAVVDINGARESILGTVPAN